MSNIAHEITAVGVDYTVGQLAVLSALGMPASDDWASAYADAVQNGDAAQETRFALEIEIYYNSALYGPKDGE